MLSRLTSDLNLDNKCPAMICSGFEVFCYRPKPDEPYHPKMHPTYNRAREKAARVLHRIYLAVKVSDKDACVSFAQTNEQIATKFFKRASDQERRNTELEKFVTAVDNWLSEFYTDAIGSKNYRTKNRYPLAPRPIESGELHVITSDDDGNLIAYKTEV